MGNPINIIPAVIELKWETEKKNKNKKTIFYYINNQPLLANMTRYTNLFEVFFIVESAWPKCFIHYFCALIAQIDLGVT